MKLTDICRVAIKANASDIHIKVGLPPLLRVNGDLVPLKNAPRLNGQQVGQMAWDLMSETQRETFKSTNDLDMAHTIQGVGRFRINVFRQRGMVGMVIRAITAKIKSLDELGLPAVLKKIAMEPRGLIVVTGTTGSGKSTTLAAMIEEININQRHHIMTIEDPIEYIFQDRRSLINQREVGTDSNSFSKALRAALRQDPDVILIGELRDKETVEIALSAAETGHLVLATLHTRDCPEAINRIVGFFEPHAHDQVRRQLSGIIRAILSQRLIPSISGTRVPAVEILINSGTISECISDSRRHAEIKDHMFKGHEQFGTQTFDQAVLDLIKREIVSQEDAMRFVNNPDELELRLSGINTGEW